MARLARGCRDIHARLSAHRRALVSRFGARAATYAFKEIETPVLEHAELYARTLGETSDVIDREMYTLQCTDPPLALRPEGTAGVARALADAGVHKKGGARVWYAGPMFRRERPQRGRYRQFWQVGVEAVCEEGLTADVEVIELADRYLHDVGVDATLRINTLGTKDDRARFNDRLREFLQGKYGKLSETSRRRFDSGNVMRVFDSKLPVDIHVLRGAPLLAEFIGPEERDRFNETKALLTEAGVSYTVDERLVRGLDYYTSTAFEFDGRTGKAVCAGGRYVDVAGLSGVGFAIGLDRIESQTCDGAESYDGFDGVVVLALDKAAAKSTSTIGRIARGLVHGFRERGVSAVGRFDGVRIGKSVPRAIRDGAGVVIVVGESEIEGGFATVKFVLREGGVEDPARVPIARVIDVVCGRIREDTLVEVDEVSPRETWQAKELEGANT